MADEKIVVFRLGNELYGLAISSVERILKEAPITPLPRTPKMLRGVFELRGETLPVLDLRLRFEMESRCDEGSFVVAQSPSGRVALRVDRVEGILQLSEGSVDDQSDAWTEAGDPFIEGIAKTDLGLVALLNPEFIVPKTIQAKVKKLELAAA